MNEIEQGIRDLIVQLNAARAENERLRRMLDLRGVGPAERYWEGRWRDEAAETDRLREALNDARWLARERRWPLAQSVLDRAALAQKDAG